MTDADLVAGRIPPTRRSRARPARRAPPRRRSTRAGVDADGVVAVVDAAMEQALRAVSVERGVDPRGLALVAFGGAGPLHACAPGRRAGDGRGDRPARGRRAVRRRAARRAPPARPGAVVADADRPRRPRRRAGRRSPTEAAPRSWAADRCRRSSVAVDCRYAGQSHELTVARSTTSTTSTSAATATPGPTTRRGGRAAGPRRRSPSPVDPAELPTDAAGAAWSARPSSPSPTARSGCPTAGGASVGAAGAYVLRRRREATRGRPRPGRAAGPDRRA